MRYRFAIVHSDEKNCTPNLLNFFFFFFAQAKNTLKSPPPENKTMKKASRISITIIMFFYLCCGCFGYAAFGDDTPGNLLTGFGFYDPYWLIDFANACIVLHLLGGYQVRIYPLQFIAVYTLSLLERVFHNIIGEAAAHFIGNVYLK